NFSDSLFFSPNVAGFYRNIGLFSCKISVKTRNVWVGDPNVWVKNSTSGKNRIVSEIHNS
ncbi:MAG: hypothetical protein LBD45_00770, partial [Bacteroidales bacterium]|nr:hypothetical protein [Bacteroidales bacterium]